MDLTQGVEDVSSSEFQRAPENPENAIDAKLLFENVVIDLHWTALQIGMLALLINACTRPGTTWTLRSRRHLMQDSAMIVQLGLRYFNDIGINQEVMFKIEKTYVHFSALKKRFDQSLFTSRSYTHTQRQTLAGYVGDWRPLVQTAMDALASSEPLAKSRLTEIYVSNSQVLREFLREALDGRTGRINQFGEMEMPNLTQHRRAARHVIEQPCTVEVRGRTTPATINNVSRGGIGLLCNAQFTVDERITVVLQDGRRLSARVVWQKAKQVGLALTQFLEFDDALFVGSPAKQKRND